MAASAEYRERQCGTAAGNNAEFFEGPGDEGSGPTQRDIDQWLRIPARAARVPPPLRTSPGASFRGPALFHLSSRAS